MKKTPVTNIKLCESEEDYRTARQLTLDYAEYIGTDLSFQNFDGEMKNFNTVYGKPNGAMIIARSKTGKCAGGVGIRRIDDETCEMKRLYVYEKFHGIGTGRMLVERSIHEAEKLGYARIRLDTFPRMKAALHLYETLGFYAIAPYRYNPDPAVYLEYTI